MISKTLIKNYYLEVRVAHTFRGNNHTEVLSDNNTKETTDYVCHRGKQPINTFKLLQKERKEQGNAGESKGSMT